MCDFHSICVRVDGAIAHVAKNSHSEAVEAARKLILGLAVEALKKAIEIK